LPNIVNLGVCNTPPFEKSLQIYTKYFETPFITATQTFYAGESSHFIALNPVPTYIAKVDQRMAEERRRVRQYLHPSTEAKLIKAADAALVGAHIDGLWASFVPLLEADKADGIVLFMLSSSSSLLLLLLLL